MHRDDEPRVEGGDDRIGLRRPDGVVAAHGDHQDVRPADGLGLAGIERVPEVA